MGKVTILHISDFHWSEAKRADMAIVVEALCRDLEELRRDDVRPDIVVFTGDLVEAGEEKTSFDLADDALFAKVLSSTGLQSNRLFVAPGNHDIARSLVRDNELLEAGTRSMLTGENSTNKFIDDLQAGNAVNRLSVMRLDNFEAYVASTNYVTATTNTPLVKTYVIDAAGYKIGLACFNTAWRASGEKDDVDRHKLLLGERNVDHAVRDLESADIRIAAFHHPLDWLAGFDEMAVASRMYSAFDLLMFGHNHQSFPEARITPVGWSVFSQAGCLYQRRGYFNGYQVVCLDPDVEQAEFVIRTYFDSPRRSFAPAVNICANGRLSLPFKLHNARGGRHPRVERVLREARSQIRATASEHMNLTERDSDKSFEVKEAFVCPPLTIRRSTALRPGTTEADGAKSTEARSEASIESLMRRDQNLMFVGQRETGKTSIAHYCAIQCAEGITDHPRIPVVIDYRNFKHAAYGLKRAIHSYLNGAMPSTEIDAALADGEFLFLVDNFTGSDAANKEKFEKLIRENAHCRWFYFTDAQPGAMVEARRSDILEGFVRVHIEDLPRKLIREMSRRWSERTGSDGEKMFALVMNQIRHDNLPRTGYIVTLLLWAADQEKRMERINEAVLLSGILDYLLGKADFEKALRREFDPTSKEITLQALASFLRDRGGIAPIDDVVEFLIGFFRQKGLSYAAVDVLAKLEECGVLVRVGEEITFKYRCFEEYFYAGLLRDEPIRLESIVKGHHFVEYERELDLLSGLRRRNSDLLKGMSEALRVAAPATIAGISIDEFSAITNGESSIPLSRSRVRDIQKKKITSDQVDEIMDAADKSISRQEKRERKTTTKSHEQEGKNPESGANGNTSAGEGNGGAVELMDMSTFMSTVGLFGRVIRNSEFADAAEKLPAARLYLQSLIRCFVMFSNVVSELFEELRNSPGGTKLGDDAIAVGSYVIRKLLMLGIEHVMNEQFGSEKLFGIYEMLLADESVSDAEKLFVAMLMLDLNHPEWKQHWHQIIEFNLKHRFVLDVFVEKMWIFIHSRALDDEERRALAAVALEIERAFGGESPDKGKFLTRVEKLIADVQRRDD